MTKHVDLETLGVAHARRIGDVLSDEYDWKLLRR